MGLAPSVNTQALGGVKTSRHEAHLVEVLVHEPGGEHNVYEYDARHKSIRLSHVAQRASSPGVECGTVANTREGASALPAVVLARVPTFPGCVVRTRVLGACREKDSPPCVIGVPEADDSRSDLDGLAQLSAQDREALGRALGLVGRDGHEWLDRDETALAITAATQEYWKAKAQVESAVRYGTAWRIEGDAIRAPGESETEPHTWAELLLRLLPLRFQQYVEEQLLPDERILFFAARRAQAVRTRHGMLRRRRLPEGLLLLTDRQVMTMVDSLPPGLAMTAWGYIAKVSAIERVEDSRVILDDPLCRLVVEFGAAGGRESYQVEFPAEYREPLQEAQRLLAGYAVPVSSTALRRHYGADRGLPREVGQCRDGGIVFEHPRMDELVAMAGGADAALASAAARPVEGYHTGPAMVVSERGVILLPGARKGECAAPKRFPIPAVSSLQLTQSVLVCRFEVFVPSGGETERVELKYNYPDSPPFVTALTLLRHLMGRAVATAAESG